MSYSDKGAVIRVETSTEFATRVPDTHYPMGTRVLVTVNLVSDWCCKAANQYVFRVFRTWNKEEMRKCVRTQ